MTTENSWEGRFDLIFPLQWFATENYTGKVDEWEFARWTEHQTKLAESRRETFRGFLRKEIEAAEQRGRDMAVDYMRGKMPLVCHSYSTEEMGSTFEAARSLPDQHE